MLRHAQISFTTRSVLLGESLIRIQRTRSRPGAAAGDRLVVHPPAGPRDVLARFLHALSVECRRAPNDHLHSSLDSSNRFARHIHAMHNLAPRPTIPTWVLQVARRCSVDEQMPSADVTQAAQEQTEASRALPIDVVRGELTEMLLGRGVHVALQWMHDAGLLGAVAARAGGDGRLLARGRPQAQGRLGSTPRRSCGSRCRGRPCAGRRCCTTSARCRRGPSLPTAASTSIVTLRRWARACSRTPRAASASSKPLKQKLKFLILHHLRPESVRVDLDRLGGASLRSRAHRAPDRSSRSVARGHQGRRGRANGRARSRTSSELAARIQALRDEDAKLPLLPTGIGNLIMEHFQPPPSRQIGDLKKALEVSGGDQVSWKRAASRNTTSPMSPSCPPHPNPQNHHHSPPPRQRGTPDDQRDPARPPPPDATPGSGRSPPTRPETPQHPTPWARRVSLS